MALSLSHIAERVFAGIVNQKRQEFLTFCGLADQADLDFVRNADTVAFCEAPLERFGTRDFDGASRIDVLVRLRSDLATAFELKLGSTRLTRTRVNAEWLRPCAPSHQDRRWSGNIMAILERKFPPPVTGDLVARAGDAPCRVNTQWFIVVRRSTARNWERAQPDFSAAVRCLAFEDIVDHLGGREMFNPIVRDLIDIDFFGEWRLGGPVPDGPG